MGAGDRASRNEYVIGSIPIGGSQRPFQIMEGAFLLTGLLTGSLDCLGENTRGGSLSGPDRMGVGPEGDGRVRV
jgi:hypothetical protein